MKRYVVVTLLVAVGFMCGQRGGAAPPSESILPQTTKGYLSIPDPDDLSKRWHQTQLGQLADDPIMQPFIDDLKEQIRNKLSDTRVRLGLDIEDVDDIAGGEICMAALQPGGEIGKHALALLVDVSDHQNELAELLTKIDKNLRDQDAKKRTEKIGADTVTIYTMPKSRPDSPMIEARYAVIKDLLIATDNAEVLEQLVGNIHGSKSPTLDKLEAFAAIVKRCQSEEADRQPQIRWFIEPFGYAYVTRAAAGGRKRRGADLLKILNHQGFDAIKGVGGSVFLATGEHEIMHDAMVYAPPIKTDGKVDKERYKLAARMLQFPNTKTLTPQPWVFRNLGTYFTFNFKMADAFEYAKTLVNEMMGAKEGQDLFEDMIGSLAEDKDGPQIDLRKDLIAHFAERVSLIGDCRRPITPDSERLMIAIELKDANAVRASINRAMENDPDAVKRTFEDHIIWEILTDNAPAEVEPLQIEGGGFDPFGAEEVVEPEIDQRERVLPNSAITVANGHLVVSTHVDFIIELLQQPVGTENLEQATDYQTVQDALGKLGADTDSFRFFTRTDEAYRTTYELIRQGKMPEAKSILGRVLNRLLGPDEQGVLREQQIDGSKLPEYDAVRRYLGPAGMFVRSEDDGWFISGCLLSKDQP